MKALLASALTALVLVTTAWASNVTPAQLNALTKRVTKLERQNAALERQSAQVTALVGCVHLRPFAVYEVKIDNGDGTFLTFPNLATPSAGDPPAFWVPTAASSSCVGVS